MFLAIKTAQDEVCHEKKVNGVTIPTIYGIWIEANQRKVGSEIEPKCLILISNLELMLKPAATAGFSSKGFYLAFDFVGSWYEARTHTQWFFVPWFCQITQVHRSCVPHVEWCVLPIGDGSCCCDRLL